MRKLFILAATLMFAAACSPDDGGTADPAKPIELTTRGAEKVSADNAFAFDFFRQTLATAPEADRANAFVSPLSLTMALGMLYNGTSPEAADEMADALGVADFTPAEINAHYQALYQALLKADPRTALAIANSIWAREGFAVKPAFYDINRQYYGAEVRSLPFDAAAVAAINKWCADNTAGRIPTILDGAISADVMMYLINAVYFKGQWKFKFDKSKTRDADFNLADGSTKTVPMMHQTDIKVPCYWDETVNCIDLPYGNGAFSMMLMMPSRYNGSLDDLIASLNGETYGRIVAGLHEVSNYTVVMPRWKQECEFPLNDAVKELGIRQIFGRGSLTGITDDPRLAVSDIKQKTFVEVNEEGTEAAAVTIIGFEVTSGPPAFIADRPFLDLIRERSTGAILFMGRMDEPQM
ncbi:MAG: serpin family protein [Alistipes sp.]|jgi:serpin B|nr:serpin family protein [Alistipes sp.]